MKLDMVAHTYNSSTERSGQGEIAPSSRPHGKLQVSLGYKEEICLRNHRAGRVFLQA